MKGLMMILVYSALLSLASSKPKYPRVSKKNNIPDNISFQAQVLPILQKKCSPCHFTGGKMYDRMPFDKPATIISHDEKLLRRLNDEKEQMLVKKFIQEQKEKN